MAGEGAMTITSNERKLFVRQCNPDVALHAGNHLYVPLDEGIPVRGSAGRSCIDMLEQTIQFGDPTRDSSDPNYKTCQLFTGFPGTGKTTELNRLKIRLNDDRQTGTHTILVDFDKYINRYAPISTTDVLRVLAYALDLEATQQETLAKGQADPPVPGYLRILFDRVARTDVEIQQMGFNAFGANFIFKFKDNRDFRRNADAEFKKDFRDFAKEAREVMTDAVVRLKKVTKTWRIVAIAGGLEKLTVLDPENRAKMEADVESIFVENASWLRLPCDAIYTFPIWLRFRTPKLGSLYDSEPQVLPMVKITEPDGSPYLPGFDKLRDLVGRRVDLLRVFGRALDQTLDPLIAASGGYPRDLLRMVRDVLMHSKELPVTVAEIERIIGELGATYDRAILQTHLDILAEIARTHELPRRDETQVASFSRLVDNYLVFAYRNGQEWYDLHPLVRQARIVKEHLTATNP